MELPGVQSSGTTLKLTIKRSSGRREDETLTRTDSGYVGPSTVTSPVLGSSLESPVQRRVGNSRPELSYAELITEALAESPHGLLSLQEIYESIRRRYSFFKSSDAAWQNSIRHNLSVNATFVKVPRPANRPGKGSLWATTKIPHKDPEEVFANMPPEEVPPKIKKPTRKSDETQMPRQNSRTRFTIEPRKPRTKRSKRGRRHSDSEDSFDSSSSEEDVRKRPIVRESHSDGANKRMFQGDSDDSFNVDSEDDTKDLCGGVPLPTYTVPSLPLIYPKRNSLGLKSFDDELDLPNYKPMYRPIAPFPPLNTSTPAAFGAKSSKTPFLTLPNDPKSLNPSPVPVSYSLSRATSPCSFFMGSQYGGSFMPPGSTTPQNIGLHSPGSSPLHGNFSPSDVSPRKLSPASRLKPMSPA